MFRKLRLLPCPGSVSANAGSVLQEAVLLLSGAEALAAQLGRGEPGAGFSLWLLQPFGGLGQGAPAGQGPGPSRRAALSSLPSAGGKKGVCAI